MALLTTSTHGSTRILELNRPEKRNALNRELIDELKSELQDANDDESIRVVIIRGAGTDFCSGADLAELKEISEYSYEQNVSDALRLSELFERIRHLRVPVIAAVHGRALAGGCGLATACDIVLAAKSARFGYPEVKIGFVPAMVAAILRRNLGEKKSFELLTQGFDFTADEALSIGLMNCLFPDDGFHAAVLEYAAVYENVSASAVEITKELLYSIDSLDFATALHTGAEANAKARMTDDFKAGIAKFLKR